MRVSFVRALLVATLLTAPGAMVWAQTAEEPAKATGAPLQLLAPLPSAAPSPGGPTLPQANKPMPSSPPAAIVTAPQAVPPAPKPVATVAPSAPALDLPLVSPPEPVTSDLFGVKQAAPPAAAELKPAPVAAVAPPAPEKPVEPRPAAVAEPEKLTVIVAGDSIADGIWGGLYRKLLRDKRYEIVRKARNSSGFVAFDWVEELRGMEEFKRADAVIFLAGTNDRQSFVRQGKPRYLFGTNEWEEGYRERVGALMQALKEQNIPLVWISLPIARKDEFNKDSRYLNNLFAQAAAKAGVHYIDIWPMFADKDGQYTAYLPDADGRNRLLRDNDGIHFTPRGYEMIADTVLETLQKRVPVFQQAAMSDPTRNGKQN
jgi:hypothetical protein